MKRLLTGAALIAIVAAVYLLRIDDAGGLFKDDAYYIVLAKAMASGQGYALINSASTPVLPAFPPGFALLLAPVVALVPSFPDNLIWLKALSIAAMMATGLLTYRYLHVYRETAAREAAAVALITTLTPGFVFLATSTVMSECAFTLALIGSAVGLERAARAAEPRSRRSIVLAALITTAAWLIRGSGIALVAGGALFLFWKRGWQAAAGFAVVCAISYSPWYVYSETRQGNEAARAAHGGDIVRYYHNPLVSKAGDPPVDSLRRRITTHLVDVFGRDLGAAILPVGYRGADESGLEVFQVAAATGPRAGSMGIGPAFVALSAVVAAFMIVGALAMAFRGIGAAEFFCVFTIGMLLLISSHSFRYVLPLVPFLVGYFLAGVGVIATRLRAGAGPSAVRIAAACLVFFLLVDHAQYIWLKTWGPAPLWIEDQREVQRVIAAVHEHLPDGAPAVSTNPGLLYLATGHKAVAYVDPDERWPQWNAAGLRFLVALHQVPQPNPNLGYRLLFESPRLRLWILEIEPRLP